MFNVHVKACFIVNFLRVLICMTLVGGWWLGGMRRHNSKILNKTKKFLHVCVCFGMCFYVNVCFIFILCVCLDLYDVGWLVVGVG